MRSRFLGATCSENRDADRTRPQGKADDFVEQFIRKLFLFGPSVPHTNENVLAQELLDSLPGVEVSVELRHGIPVISKLSERSNLSYRTALQAFDRVLLYYRLRGIHEKAEYGSHRDNLPICLFMLEVAKHLDEAAALDVLLRHSLERGRSAKEHLQRLRKGRSAGLSALFSLFEDAEFREYIADNETWVLAFRLMSEGVWKDDTVSA